MMTARNPWSRTGSILAVTCLLASACGSDGTNDDDGSQPGDGLPGDGAEDDGSDAGDGEPDGDGDAGGPVLCGVTDTICNGDTPVCVEGRCVECGPDDTSRCSEGQVCEPTSHTCQSPTNTPFALDCANLPSDGACQGGPREVLLVTESTGLVLMFDPADGHYLGVFKRSVPDLEGSYWTATQGPDQCIWTSGQGETLGVQRWNPDGTFKDEIIPRGKYFDGQDDVVQDPRGLAFTQNEVYVASTDGEPSARLLRFPLDQLPAPENDPEPQSRYEVVIDDGSLIGSLIVRADGSMVVSNKLAVQQNTVQRLELRSADGAEVTPLYSDFESFDGPTQVSYAGDGKVLAGDSWNGVVFRVDVETGMGTDPILPVESSKNIYGVYQLGNGNWLYASDGAIESLDWDSTNPTGQHESLWNDASVITRDFRYVGRACLSNEFVESRGEEEPPVDACAEPEGAVLLAEDFDDGVFTPEGDGSSYNGFVERPADGVTVAIDATLGADGSSGSLKISGAPATEGGDPTGPDGQASGVVYDFEHVKPSYVSYFMRLAVPDAWAGYFVLNSVADDWIDGVYATSEDGVGNLSTYASNVSVPYAANTWIRVQMRDFDWEARTYDLYVDCERVGDDIAFRSDAPDVTTIELYNLWPEDVAWYDQIVIK